MIFICRLAAFLDLNSLRDSEPDFFMKRVPFFCTYRVCESEQFFPKKLSVLLITYLFYWKAASTNGNHFRSRELNHRLTGLKGGGFATQRLPKNGSRW